ncbi:MAG TPA: BON domain-containing protein [Burkholderiales bacterium]|nr:BON domain-containing protein [Burkholderiales bacterium]
MNPKLLVVNAALAVAMAALIAGCGGDRNESTVMETLDTDANTAATTAADADAGMYPQDGSATGTGTDEIAALDGSIASLDDSIVIIKVESALFSDPNTKGLEVQVQAHEGTVELSGILDTQAQIDSAVATTLEVEGVKSVENKLALKADSPPTGEVADRDVISAN